MNLRIITVCIILSAAMTLAQKDFPSTDVDAVVPEVSLVEDESPLRSSEDKAVMHAMKKLKAWCQIAADSDFYNNPDKLDANKNAIFEIIRIYSQDPADNSNLPGGSANNIVTQYGLMMAQLEKDHAGVFKYLVDKIDHAVITGTDFFTMDTDQEYVFFDYDVLGFTERPEYFTNFKVKVEDWTSQMMKIPAGQEAQAILSALHSEKDSYYHQALKSIVAQNNAKQLAYEEECQRATLSAIKGADKAETGDDGDAILHPLADAGAAACEGVQGDPPPNPSMEEMQQEAAAQASKQVKEYAATANLARIAKEGEEKERIKKEIVHKEQQVKAAEIEEKTRIAAEKVEKKESADKAVAEKATKAELVEKAEAEQVQKAEEAERTVKETGEKAEIKEKADAAAAKEAGEKKAAAQAKHDEEAEKAAAEAETKAKAKEASEKAVMNESSEKAAEQVTKVAEAKAKDEEKKAQAAKEKEIADKQSAEISEKYLCVPKITTHTSHPCAGDDCKAKVSCPTGTSPVRCETVGSHAGDGIFFSDTLECVAQGSDATPVSAKVTCTSCATSTIAETSASSYLDNQIVTADCPVGTNVVDCNCLSAWGAKITCPGTQQGRFDPVDGSCSLMIPPSVASRRRNVGSGAGAKITALCNKAPQRCVPKLTTHKSDSCQGDDCKAKVACPANTAPVKCTTVGATAGDGAYFEKDSLKCVAQGSNSQEISAEVTCTSCPTDTTSETSAATYLDNQIVSASCPSGMNLVDCNCVSAWTANAICPGTSRGRFDPKDGRCSIDVPVSAGRRRGNGWGAGAMVYALCNKDVPVCPKQVTKHTSNPCTGDDCKSKVSCSANAAPISCRTVGATAADGAYVNEDLECVAQGDGSTNSVSAEVTCSTCMTEVTAKSSADMYLDNQKVSASCPDGYTVEDCSCNSAWKAASMCPGTSQGRFDPADGKCSLDIPQSSGRRRNVGAGAGAKITALCSKNAA